MTSAMNQIFQIDGNRKTPKYLQIVHCITKAIKNGSLRHGDRIPSINELSSEFDLSRQTIQKAYALLIDTGILVPMQGKGYYINRTDIVAPYHILLLFNKISNYKKQIYNAFIQRIGSKAIVDIKIHHSNAALLDDFVTGHVPEYDYVLIMPHFYEETDKAYSIIKSIPRDKLILLDKDIPELQAETAVFQDFKNDLMESLESAINLLRKYQELVLVFPKIVSYPEEIIASFRNFCIRHGFKNRLVDEINQNHDLLPGQVYLMIEEMDLVHLIRRCKSLKLTPGSDIGIISFNETPLKEILLDGITVVSADHEKMGEMAADLILQNRKEKLKCPFHMIIRNTL